MDANDRKQGLLFMKLPPSGATLVWLVRDTLRQSLACGVFWILLAISIVSTLVCLSAGVEGGVTISSQAPEFLPANDRDAQHPDKIKHSGVAILSGNFTLAGGAVRIPLARDARGAVHFVQLVLAGGVADTLGFLLAMIWTAGFLPSFLEARSASVLLSKRTPRWLLLWGKYLGVLTFVALQAVIFVGSTWLALGCRTGIWDTAYLLCIPLLLLHFAIFFSVSVLLAVWTQSTVLCVFGSIFFWCLAWGMNYGRHAAALAARAVPEGTFSPRFSQLADVGYWLLPKPADLGALLYDTVGEDHDFARLLDYSALESQGFSMALAVASSVVFALVVMLTATYSFETLDY